MRKRLAFGFLVFALLLSACNVAAPVQPTQGIDDIVQQTFVALTVQAAVAATPAPSTPDAPATFTPPPKDQTGSIAGSLSYPADSLPAMRVVAFSTTSDLFSYVDTLLGQNYYQIDNLPAGTYHVVAYSLGGGSFPVGLSGGFTQEMRGNTGDHTLVSVEVKGNQITQSINLGDWNAPAGAYPAMPGQVPPTPDGPKPLKPEGGITGHLSYPAEGRPDIMVVAFSTQYYPNGNFYYVFTTPSQDTYELVLPQGEYYIVAYALDPLGKPMGVVGGYTQAVPCGLSVSCTDHSLIPVPVAAGGAMGDIDPADWYAPEGSFPPYPLK